MTVKVFYKGIEVRAKSHKSKHQLQSAFAQMTQAYSGSNIKRYTKTKKNMCHSHKRA